MIGAGHGHLHLARHAMQLVDAGLTPTLVDPGRFWYSGMATGVLGGVYEPEQHSVDPRPLIEAHGGHFVQDQVVRIDRQGQRVHLTSGHTLHYDFLSFNVGSEVDLDLSLEGLDNAWAVKPIANLWRLRHRLEDHFDYRPDQPLRLVIIGGGATGCEVACNIDRLARRHGGRVELTLVTRDGLMQGYPRGATRRMMQLLRARSIQVVNGSSVNAIEQGQVITDDGHRLPWDVLIAACGLRPPRWLGEQGLAVAGDGALLVDKHLRSVDDPKIFGVGDCVQLQDHPLPRVGVFGVRQAPVLLHNLCAAANGRALKRYHPQKRYLSILNTGDGKALAARGGAWWYGRSSLWLKDWIDRRFVQQYRV